MSTTEHFRQLAISATGLMAEMVCGWTPEQQQLVDQALKGGGKIYLEFGPFPKFQGATAYLIEPEGKRNRLSSYTVAAGP